MKHTSSHCAPHQHSATARLRLPVGEAELERCARIFRALGDTARLRLIGRLTQGAACVGELAEVEQESITTISQRLRILRADNLVQRRREGKHVLYSLADQHMLNLVLNGLAHASETATLSFQSPEHMHFSAPQLKGSQTMSTQHTIHPDHTHEHGADCGHTAIEHDGHIDFLHDGHLHHEHDGHIDEHKLDVNAANPADCTDGHPCDAHDTKHVHGSECGHEAVPHGDHVDFLVDGHLHHQHDGHCDNHGNVQVAQ